MSIVTDTVKDMECEIVTSHDPNKRFHPNGRIDETSRLIRFKTLKYKLIFE